MAKGTFYLYFKDKYDIRDRLITHKADRLFEIAYEELEKVNMIHLRDCILFYCGDNIVESVEQKPVTYEIYIEKSQLVAFFKRKDRAA